MHFIILFCRTAFCCFVDDSPCFHSCHCFWWEASQSHCHWLWSFTPVPYRTVTVRGPTCPRSPSKKNFPKIRKTSPTSGNLYPISQSVCLPSAEARTCCIQGRVLHPDLHRVVSAWMSMIARVSRFLLLCFAQHRQAPSSKQKKLFLFTFNALLYQQLDKTIWPPLSRAIGLEIHKAHRRKSKIITEDWII